MFRLRHYLIPVASGFLVLGLISPLLASPALETSHATHSEGGGGHVFTMRVDSSGDEVAYRGTCYSVGGGGLEPQWTTEGWYAPHGDLILSEGGNYLVRTNASLEERIRFSDNLGAMPCIRLYEEGKPVATYKMSDLVKDLSKVVRGPEFYVGWLSEIAVEGDTIEIMTVDGAKKSIDLSKAKRGAAPKHVQNWGRLKAGMTEDAVIALLGKPLKMVEGPSSSGFTGPRMLCWGDVPSDTELGQVFTLTNFFHVVFADDGTVKSWHRPKGVKTPQSSRDSGEQPDSDGESPQSFQSSEP